jgi:hypothetical protein
MTALAVGQGRERTRLFDNQWQPIWDSATATTPAYAHIASWVHAVIDRADGTRWIGQFYRCPEGIRRWAYEDLEHLIMWPNPLLEMV